jgi:peptidoglycan/LPS O-acetylase OafA/YrhL
MTSTIPRASAREDRHYLILDALRFVLAFWVMLAHTGLPPIFSIVHAPTGFVGHLFVQLYHSLVYGMPAVMGFFVISGFCIHLPFRTGKQLPVARFYARRYVRIMIPVLAGVALFRLIAHAPLYGEKSPWWESVLWSLLCEEIYYAAYPAMLWFRRRFGWAWLLAPAYAASFAITLTHTHWPNWLAFGPIYTTIALYPVWLLGCVLAEQSDALKPFSSRATIWAFRFGIWFCAWLCLALNFRTAVLYPQTMAIFGTLAYFWIRKELAFRAPANDPQRVTRLLAACGAWSYSLYLMHIPMSMLYARLVGARLGPMSNWFALKLFVLASAFCFYLAVERPSHRLARRIGSLDATSPQPASLHTPTPRASTSNPEAAGPDLAAPAATPSGSD